MYIPQFGCSGRESLEEHEIGTVVTVHIGPFRHAPPSSLSLPSVPSLVCYAPCIGEIRMNQQRGTHLVSGL
jgi:hypothetical protein